jgi:molecular chaperone Hsp33
MTVDQGPNTSRYQGIVELEEGSLEDAAHRYLRQSEQIPTRVRLSVAELVLPSASGQPVATWRAGGLVAQFLPKNSRPARDLPGGDDPDPKPAAMEPELAWEEAETLAASASDDELTDPQVGCERLLFRLFHERGVRVFAPQPVRAECACSKQRVIGLLRGLPEEERGFDPQTGLTEVTCEFCSTAYRVARADIENAGALAQK